MKEYAIISEGNPKCGLIIFIYTIIPAILFFSACYSTRIEHNKFNNIGLCCLNGFCNVFSRYYCEHSSVFMIINNQILINNKEIDIKILRNETDLNLKRLYKAFIKKSNIFFELDDMRQIRSKIFDIINKKIK